MFGFKRRSPARLVCAFSLAVLVGVTAFPVMASERNPEASAAYEVHEWGVMVGCGTTSDYQLTSRPLRINIVKEPVLYFHSQDKKPFALKVTFNQGTPTETYPKAVKNGPTLQWDRVTFTAASAPKATKGFQLDDGLVTFNEIADTLNNVDADEIESGGVKAKFLFYEGEMPYVNPLTSSYDAATQEVTVVNTGQCSVFDLYVFHPQGLDAGDFLFTRHPALAYVREVKPGETIRVKPEKVTEKVDFTKSLRELGFTGPESAAFAVLWSNAILESAQLFYRLPQTECERLISLEFTPRPQKISRALYVLVEN